MSRPMPRPGLYDGPYWQYSARGELRLQRCSQCAHLRYPPGPVCPRCLSADYDWTALSGRGRVFAWTIFHRPYFPELPVPYTVVSVQTDEGPLLIGNLLNGGKSPPRLGLPVRALFEEVDSPGGPWRLCQWEPDTERNSE